MTDQIIANVYTFILSGFLEFLKSFLQSFICLLPHHRKLYIQKNWASHQVMHLSIWTQTKSWSCQKKFYLIYIFFFNLLASDNLLLKISSILTNLDHLLCLQDLIESIEGIPLELLSYQSKPIDELRLLWREKFGSYIHTYMSTVD